MKDAAMMKILPGEILFLHGLEGSPMGNKARWLRERYLAEAVPMDTSKARQGVARLQLDGTSWRWGPEDAALALAPPMAQVLAALADKPRRLLVGSSFGGAVLMELVQLGHWRGPCIFLAAAAAKMGRRRPLPVGVQAVVIHGRRDDVVPIADSRNLAADSGGGVVLWEVDEDHTLAGILTDGTLERAVSLLLGG